jgi:hypothetical protein
MNVAYDVYMDYVLHMTDIYHFKLLPAIAVNVKFEKLFNSLNHSEFEESYGEILMRLTTAEQFDTLYNERPVFALPCNFVRCQVGCRLRFDSFSLRAPKQAYTYTSYITPCFPSEQ